MHPILRGSTAVRVVRQSRIVQLLARAWDGLRRRLGRDTDDDSEPDSGDDPNSNSGPPRPSVFAGSVLGGLRLRGTNTDETPTDDAAGQQTDETAPASGVFAGSLLAGFVARLQAWLTGAWLYRWLTAEPDPDVIVIDLRETRIVGPILAVLDWVLDRLTSSGDGSLLAALARRTYRAVLAHPIRLFSIGLGGLALAVTALAIRSGTTLLIAAAAVLAVAAAVGTRVQLSWAELRETRPVELLVAAFEPPEPPEQADTAGDDAEDQ